MDLFYVRPDQVSNDRITLDTFEAKHLLKTLRKKIGDVVAITDGKGRHYTGKIAAIKPKLEIQIESLKEIKQTDKKIALGIAFIRPNRLDFVLEKCTELGVNTFYIYRSEHANYFSSNYQRYEKILRQSIKQSNRFYLPDLYLIPDFKPFVDTVQNSHFKIAAIDSASPPIGSIIKKTEQKDVLYCVGPEGGFSAQEISLLKECNFNAVSLGAFRLRAETAAIAGISRLVI